MTGRKLISMTRAAERLGISRVTLRKRVKAGKFTVYEDPLDARLRLLDEAEVDAAREPRPIIDEPKKAAA